MPALFARSRCQSNKLEAKARRARPPSIQEVQAESNEANQGVYISAMLFLLTLLIGALSPQPVSAISPQVHWAAHSVIPVWVDRQNLPAQGDQLVDRAMGTWTNAADGAFTLQRTFAMKDAGIRIYFNGAGGNYGETRPHVDPASGLITAAEVAIAADVPIEVDPLTR